MPSTEAKDVKGQDKGKGKGAAKVPAKTEAKAPAKAKGDNGKGDKGDLLPALTAQEQKIRKEVVDLRKLIDKTSFRMAELLYKVYDGGLYMKFGYTTWKEYCEAELQFTTRKAQYLVSLWEYFGVQYAKETEMRAAIEALGWSKAKELIGVATPENYKEWVEKSQNSTLLQVVEMAREALKSDDKDKQKPKDTEQFKSLGLRLTQSQHDNVSKAISKAGEISGSDKKGNCVDLICTDFLATNTAPTSKKARRQLFARIEAQFGLKVVVLDEQANEIVYGKATIDKWAKEAAEKAAAK